MLGVDIEDAEVVLEGRGSGVADDKDDDKNRDEQLRGLRITG